MTQGIRPSQFVIAYGPGAILETKNGPVVIPSPDIGLFHKRSKLSPGDYEVDTTINALMTEREGRDIGIFRIPTNSELGRLSDDALYKSIAFPSWRLCLRQGMHRNALGNAAKGRVAAHLVGQIDILHKGDRCPICTHTSDGKSATSFVSVCANGHLDDIDWPYIVHKGSCKGGRPDYFLWVRRGGTLRDIDLVCPRCNEGKANFGQCFYANHWRCTGRSPEREQPGRPYHSSCKKKSRIMQRQAASIRVPEVQTYLSIHPTYTRLDNMARSSERIKTAAIAISRGVGDLAKDSNFKSFISLLRDVHVPDNTIAEFERAKRDEAVRVIADMMAPTPKSHRDMLNREYDVLMRASREGAPSSPPADDLPPSFEVRKQDVRRFATSNGRQLAVVPIRTLETVTVQVGFRRIVPSGTPVAGDEALEEEQPKLVKTDFTDPANRVWYPGTSFLGEGLFITLGGGGPPNLSGLAEAAWRKSREVEDGYHRHLFRDPDVPGDELDPRFVWWHTLAHLLVRSISERAGYSAASIRERVYFAGDNGAGGILLYATQPGTEGTMGGLVGLAPRLEQFLDGVEERALTCSADPLCKQGGFAHGRLSGSCCYGCLMNPETSCEHRNMWLDRAIVRENLP